MSLCLGWRFGLGYLGTGWQGAFLTEFRLLLSETVDLHAGDEWIDQVALATAILEQLERARDGSLSVLGRILQSSVLRWELSARAYAGDGQQWASLVFACGSWARQKSWTVYGESLAMRRSSLAWVRTSRLVF